MNHQVVGQRSTPIHWAVELSTWVPAANVAYGLTALFIKYAYIPFASEATIDGSRFLTKIDRESGWTPILILIPFFGRLGVFLYDRHSKRIALENMRRPEASLANLSPWLRNDRDVVLAAVSHHPLDLQYADRLLQNDRAVALRAIRGNSRAFAFASEALQQDIEVQLSALEGSPELLTQFAEQRRLNPARAEQRRLNPARYGHVDNQFFFQSALARNRNTYPYVPAWLPRDDPSLVSLMIELNPLEFNRASEFIKNSQEIQLKAIHEEPALFADIALRYPPGERKTILFLELAIRANQQVFQHLPVWLFQPKYEATFLKLTNLTIRCAPREFKDLVLRHLPACLDQEKHANFLLEIMKYVIQESGSTQSFQYLPQSLSGSAHTRAVKRFTITVVRQDPIMLKYAFPREQDDLDVVFSTRLYGANGMDLALPFASERIRALHQNAERFAADEEAMLDAIAEDAAVLRCYSDAERHKNNKDFMLKAIARNPQAFLCASHALKSNFDVALAAVSGDGSLFKTLPTPLNFSIGLAHAAYKNNPQILNGLNDTPKWKEFVKNPLFNDKAALFEGIGEDASVVLHFATEEQRKDREFMLRAIQCNADAFLYADEELKNDPDFVDRAASARLRILEHISNPLVLLPFLGRVHIDFLDDCWIHLDEDIRYHPEVTSVLLRRKGAQGT